MDLYHWIKAHPELFSVILFSDEASFTRDSVNNLRNVHTRSHDNPHEKSLTNFQRRLTVNVWCGVLGNKLIGPLVFDNNFTGNAYEVFLRKELPGLLEDIPLMIRSLIYLCSKLIPECTFSYLTSPLGRHVSCIVLGTLRTNMTSVRMFL